MYPLFETYQRLKKEGKRFDNMDLVAHIYQALDAHGYKGTEIHGLYRDEVRRAATLPDNTNRKIS